MRLSKIALLSACALALAPITWAQRPSGVEADTTTTYTGKLVFDFTITIESTISTSEPIYCIADAQVGDELGSFTEIGSVTATRSGSSATCTVTIPYSWGLESPSSDKVTLTAEVIADTNDTLPPVRDAKHPLGQISIPANGATTTESVKFVL